MNGTHPPVLRRRNFLGVPLADAPWLIYLAFFFIAPFFEPQQRWQTWAGIAVIIAAFLPLYGWTHRVIDARPWVLRKGVPGGALGVAAMIMFTVAISFVNAGAASFAIYAAAAAGKLYPRQRALTFIVLSFGGLVAGAFISPVPLVAKLVSFGTCAVLVPIIGLTVLAQRERFMQQEKLNMAQEEVEQLATIAERERIARDLHDVLGHTLSTITLKAELASHLLASNPEQAAREIRDVERLSRQSLSEVRSAVRGYRSVGLAGELANAKLALEAAGVNLDYFFDTLSILPAAEGVLTFALREAVTNVVRHASATHCRITLHITDGHVVLSVADDGSGVTSNTGSGSGLPFMRERVRALGGYVHLTPSRSVDESGVRLDVGIPLTAALVPEAAV